MVRDVQRSGGTHFTLPIATRNPLLYRRNTGLLTGIIQDNAVDLVHARSRAPAWSAMRAARTTGVPFVTTFHGTYGSNNGLKRRYNSVMTKGDRVIAISDFVNQHIRDGYKIDPEKLVTIHRGVDTSQFDPAAVSAARIIQLSQAWRLPDGVPVIMLPGRITRWKGQQILIEALYRLPHRDFICVIVGSAKRRATYRDDLAKTVRERNLESVVSFVDHEQDMAAAYMLADVVVSASTDPEAFGRVAAEALAMGRPVVATDHGGSRETVVPGETGWLVRPGDPGDWRRQLPRPWIWTLVPETRWPSAPAAALVTGLTSPACATPPWPSIRKCWAATGADDGSAADFGYPPRGAGGFCFVDRAVSRHSRPPPGRPSHATDFGAIREFGCDQRAV